MRIIEKTITYELTRREVRDATLENEMILEASQFWDATNIPRMHEMILDTKTDLFYAKVTYVRAS